MLANHVESLEDYYAVLENRPKGVAALYQDILISVTSFFRDPVAFQEPARQISRYMKYKPMSDGVFRAWIPGCGTGEEVYTIAMIISEVIRKKKLSCRVQIFATDISDLALAVARKAVYPDTVVGRMPKDCKERYLNVFESGYQVKKPIRDMVIFARQDVLKDPPFLKLDLISCRNLMIYFGPDAQDRLFRVFNYALAPGGILFLGKSESVGKHEKHFKTLNQSSRVFERDRGQNESPGLMHAPELPVEKKLKLNSEAGKSSIDALLNSIPRFAPHSALIDESMNVKKVYGAMSDLLRFREGDLSHSLMKLMAPEMKSEVTTLLHRCRKERRRVNGYVREASIGKKLRVVQFSILPLKVDGNYEYLVELIRNDPPTKARAKAKKVKAPVGSRGRMRELEEELIATKEHLQTTVEELETSNEELHSTNEELTTLNEELNVKSMEAAALNDHLEAVQNAIQYPLFVVDRNLNLVRYNAPCTDVFRTEEVLIGRNLRMIPTRASMDQIFDAVENCVRNGESAVDEKAQVGLRSYNIKARALISDSGEVQGAVVVMVDMTDYMAALKKTSDVERMLQSLLRNTPALVSLKDAAGRYTFVNERFCTLFQKAQAEILGRTDEEVFGEELADENRKRDFEALRMKASVTFE